MFKLSETVTAQMFG